MQECSLWILVLLHVAEFSSAAANATECQENEYRDDRGKCAPCRECGPGQELSKDCGYGDGGDDHCMNCRPRRYKESWGSHRCKPCLSCALLNRVQTSKCTGTSNSGCGECLQGFYSKTRIGGMRDLECIPCTKQTPSTEPQCKTQALGGSEKKPSGSGGSSSLHSMSLAVVICSALIIVWLALSVFLLFYCDRTYKDRSRLAGLRSQHAEGDQGGASATESSSSAEGTFRFCLGKNRQKNPPPATGTDAKQESFQDQPPATFQSCLLQANSNQSTSPFPGSGSKLQYGSSLSESQPLIRTSDCSDCSTGCPSARSSSSRTSPEDFPEASAANQEYVTTSALYCASGQQQRWQHSPVECTESDLQESFTQEMDGTAWPVSQNPLTFSSTKARDFQDLIERTCRITQGLHIGQLPEPVVGSLTLKLKPSFLGAKDYRHVGEKLGISPEAISTMTGFNHIVDYLSSSTLASIPDLLGALRNLQRFDTVFLLCSYFTKTQGLESVQEQTTL
ncbi:tumor necrosis factor receptor superfamily member 27 [Latimeria chalumnae]|uniref:tumor necrosis factor receptor superfamily member 27 n=1 Tax=Latimeria chalumnae TaxID=7897 RepID=UPI0003C1507F|nr:PREDICTED: tumor necrosis factor receptor superfamily member 27 [Latimeria chalumnae]|eukprot:XP_005990883.1 PREDICTED: tumor necrosis factor receptor superfamily member 27 [Latimeria chalumnae]